MGFSAFEVLAPLLGKRKFKRKAYARLLFDSSLHILVFVGLESKSEHMLCLFFRLLIELLIASEVVC